MAAVITRWASKSTSSSPRSTTTRRPRSGAWTSPFARPRAATTKRVPCWRHSTSRSGSEEQPFLKRGYLGDTYGEEEFDREKQPAAEDVAAGRAQARQAEGDRAR